MLNTRCLTFLLYFVCMKQKISIITLGVKDFQASRTFYCDGLGFTPKHEMENIIFFDMNGVVFALYPHDKLEEEVPVAIETQTAHSRMTIAHNIASKEEVDEVLAFAEKAGATLIKPGQDVFWGGYSGYFADPDGFLWEVAYNPYDDLT